MTKYPKQAATPARWFIANLGDQRLGDELSRLAENDPRIILREGMKCLDRQNKEMVKDLYEIPIDVRDRVMRMARGAGFQYMVLSFEDDASSGGMPKERFAQIVPIRIDPFEAARKARRGRGKFVAALPVGVSFGSSLIGRAVRAKGMLQSKKSGGTV